MTLTIAAPAEVHNTAAEQFSDATMIARLTAGEVVRYRAHMPGGMVLVRLVDGRTGVLDPRAAEELR